MKTTFVKTLSILVVLAVIALPTRSVSAANGGKECKDPKAPCTSETFSSATVDQSGITPYSVISTVTYTCGVNVYNSVGTKLATLSETATVRWRTDGYNILNGSRSAWVKYPSTTYWYQLSGPSGIGSSGGTAGTPSWVVSSGKLIYTAVYDGTATVTLSFSYDRHWSCSSSYAK